MKNKYIQIRNGAGQYNGVKMPWTAREVIQISLGLAFGTALALGVVKLGNASFGVKPAVAAVQMECQSNDGVYDCTTSGTKAHVYEIASQEGIEWHDLSEFALNDLVDSYAKRYPKAKREVVKTIITVAQAEQFSDVDYLFKLISCESKFNPSEINTRGNSPVTSKDRGLLQFNSYWQKKVSDKCAFDATCSLTTAIEMLKNGQQSLWACDRLIK